MAYAAVISVKHKIKHLIDPAKINLQTTNSAYEKLEYIESFLKELNLQSHQSFDISAIKALDAGIIEAAWKLEDSLDSYAFSHSLPPSYNNGCPQIPLVDEKDAEQAIRSLTDSLDKLGSDFNTLLANPLVGEDEEEDEDEEGAVSSIPSFGKKISLDDESKEIYRELVISKYWLHSGSWLDSPETLTRVDDQFKRIIGELMLWPYRGLKTVTLVGMAGIGKTHLARRICQSPLILQRFKFIVWVRVGQRRRSNNMLLDIVSEIEGKPRSMYLDKDDESLQEALGRKLNERPCLVVLDDTWSPSVYEDVIRRLRTAGVNRVLLTTRIQRVDKLYYNTTHKVRFLDNEKSWNLLRENVFVDESSFPAELEKVGRKIAENCEGLPLLILAVAEILRGDEKTEEHWSKVSNKKSSTFMDAYDKISKVLISSYQYLSVLLKTCFLYMGVFGQSRKIPTSKLVNLLTAEDFLEPNELNETLEEFIVDCVKKLVSNSVVIVCKRSYNRRIKSCKLHSAYWYLCIKEARMNKFFHVLDKLSDGSEDYIEGQRRFSVQNNILFGMKEVRDAMAAAVKARSLVCTGEDHPYPVPVPLDMMFLKVLDARSFRFYEFPNEVVKLLLLRYLTLTHSGKLPSSISNLQQLQFLILRQYHNIKLVRNPTYLPEEIWDVEQLAHLRIMGCNLPNPSSSAKLPNLVTLYVNARSCTKAVYGRIRNLNKLGITIELQPDNVESFDCFKHIRILDHLKSVKCVVVNPNVRSQLLAPPHHLSNFPRNLKKLSLNGLGYPWEHMSAIGSLRYLNVLKLRCSAFRGPKWETEAGEFERLEFLLLEDMDVVEWKIHNKYGGLPNLQRLTIRHCFKLKEIPFETLGSKGKIELVDCSPTLVASVRHSPPRVVVNSSWSR